MRVCGLDPSLASFGGAITTGPGIAPELVRIRPGKLRGHERLAFLLSEVECLARGADLAVVEGVLARMPGAEAHLNLAGLHWLVRHQLWTMGIPYAVVTPSTRMKWLTGKGQAEKDECLTTAIKRFPLADIGGNDEADALVLAAMGSAAFGCHLVPMPADRTVLLHATRTDKSHRGEPVIDWPRQGALSAGALASARPPGEDRDKALQAALDQIEKQYGKGAVMRMGDEQREAVEVIPTGSIALDVALGIGGLPRGRVIEVYGPESSGKTTVALHAVANAQKAGGIAAFIDAEHALDPDYAQKLGVDTDALLISQPDTGEQALEIADTLIRSGAIDIVVIDSVAALVPKAEIEGEMGDSHVGLQARLMSQALRKLTGTLSQTKTTIIFINQLRERVGVMFGNPETTTGGKALKFYASVRLDIRRIETLKDGTEAVGNRTRVKVVKNKMAPPHKTAEFDILYGLGISREGGLIDLGVEQGIVRKAGAWYTYEDGQLGQGKENARSFLKDNPDLANEIEKKIKEKLGVGPRIDAAAPGEPSSVVAGNGSS